MCILSYNSLYLLSSIYDTNIHIYIYVYIYIYIYIYMYNIYTYIYVYNIYIYIYIYKYISIHNVVWLCRYWVDCSDHNKVTTVEITCYILYVLQPVVMETGKNLHHTLVKNSDDVP